MRGDKLVITEFHRKAAQKIFESLKSKWKESAIPLTLTIAGESGCGKSEIAQCLADEVKTFNKTPIILSQDDYFKLPPESNHEQRVKNLNNVGPAEVNLELLDYHLLLLKSHKSEELEKPLVYFQENRIGSETIDAKNLDLIIAEGTYTTLLENVDLRTFIKLSYKETKKIREERGRDSNLDIIEKILEIEHNEIKKHEKYADIIIYPSEINALT